MLGPPARSSFAKLQLWWALWHWSKLKIGGVGIADLFLCICPVGEEIRRVGNRDEFYADIVTSHRRTSKRLEGEFDSDRKPQESRCLSRSFWSIRMESLGQAFMTFFLKTFSAFFVLLESHSSPVLLFLNRVYVWMVIQIVSSEVSSNFVAN